jgi:predicted TIM-barrel fold metal-dependent hydrolase
MTIQPLKIIDPHIHLFNLKQGKYHWLRANNPPFWSNKSHITKTFTEQDLKLTSVFELTGFVHIEAGFDNRQPWREIAYLEKSCQLPFRSIAFIDLLLTTKAFKQHLQKLLSYSSVIGCRYILDEQALTILTKTQVLSNLNLLAEHNLLFEVQMPLSDDHTINALIALLIQQPNLQIVINHAGCPQLKNLINKKIDDNWLKNIDKLAQFEQCTIKCSGWEMADNNYTIEQVKMIVRQCLTSFGEKRVMLASNFPLCLFSKSYQNYWQDQQKLLNLLNLNEQQQALLRYNNARRSYQLCN